MSITRNRGQLALLATGFILLSSGISLAHAEDEKVYPEVKLSSPLSRSVQSAVGLTPLSSWLGGKVLERVLAEKFDGKLDVDLNTYSATDLIGGKAAGIRIVGKNLVYDEFVPISQMTVETAEGSHVYVQKGKKPVLLNPVDLKLNAVITEQDLNTMLKSKKGQELLAQIKVPLPPFKEVQLLDLVEPAIEFTEDGKFRLKTQVNIHGASPENALPVEVAARLKPDDKVLKLDDVDLDIEGIGHAGAVESFLEDYFGELFDDIVDVKISRHKVRLTFEKSDIADDKLHLQASMRIEPDEKTLAQLTGKQEK